MCCETTSYDNVCCELGITQVNQWPSSCQQQLLEHLNGYFDLHNMPTIACFLPQMFQVFEEYPKLNLTGRRLGPLGGAREGPG